jgi:hypothetical protein
LCGLPSAIPEACKPFNGAFFVSSHDFVREMLVRLHLGLIVANPDEILKLPIELDRAKML